MKKSGTAPVSEWAVSTMAMLCQQSPAWLRLRWFQIRAGSRYDDFAVRGQGCSDGDRIRDCAESGSASPYPAGSCRAVSSHLTTYLTTQKTTNPERGSPIRAPAPGTRRPVHGDAIWLRAAHLTVVGVNGAQLFNLRSAFPSALRSQRLGVFLSIDHSQLIVNVFAALVPPPGVGLKTVTLAVPAVLMSATGTVAVKVVPLTYVVVSFVPFHSILEPEI